MDSRRRRSTILVENEVVGHRMKIVPTTSFSDLEIKYPYKKVDAPNIVKFLFQLNEKKGHKLKNPFGAYVKEALKLIEDFGKIETIRIMIDACNNCNTSFSFTYVRKHAYNSKVKRARCRNVKYP